MTYPEPRYLGEGGERTATYRPADHEPELVYANGTTGALSRDRHGDRRPVRAVPMGDGAGGQRARPALPSFHRRIVLRPARQHPDL